MNEVAEYKNKEIVPFDDAWKEAQVYAASGMVNKDFRNPEACYVAFRMAEEMGVALFPLMQSLYRVHEKVGLESKFAIALINNSGIFGPLNYVMGGEGDDYGCRVEATRHSDGLRVQGSRVTIGIAKAEGWYSKAGSKWKSMPEQMLRYRAAMFFARTECPQVLFGMQSREEIQDTEAEYVTPLPETQEAIPEIPEIPPDNPVDVKPKFPPLRICCNANCKSNNINEPSGCNGELNDMRNDPKNPANPYLYHCRIDKFVQTHPNKVFETFTPGLVSDAKAALGWNQKADVTDPAKKWELIYKVLGIGGEV